MKIDIFIFFCGIWVEVANCQFAKEFRNFIYFNFGADVERRLTRADLGTAGSFGGKRSNPLMRRKKRIPVIFLHGITFTAGTMMPLRDSYLQNGYMDDELYGTSYGPLGEPKQPKHGGVHCAYPKQVCLKLPKIYSIKFREMILAVLSYTKSPTVNILGFSMGVMVTRKAILGGNCVDTNEYIGPPLTDYITTYIGVAGPNHGGFMCEREHLLHGVFAPSCGLLKGMKCHSQYLNDINSRYPQ